MAEALRLAINLSPCVGDRFNFCEKPRKLCIQSYLRAITLHEIFFFFSTYFQFPTRKSGSGGEWELSEGKTWGKSCTRFRGHIFLSPSVHSISIDLFEITYNSEDYVERRTAANRRKGNCRKLQTRNDSDANTNVAHVTMHNMKNCDGSVNFVFSCLFSASFVVVMWMMEFMMAKTRIIMMI